ncbi:hypothetical protein K438DRAFT_1983018 [Mycena galopus ATCC 62051]|nr:hypothetical protein K438DRAFT_2001828 [Mycena galopus ATCC 62051]KAF8169892.1 hypothetical protein K438DRAFT_1983018 [Mycena galopus ATCC 62051]
MPSTVAPSCVPPQFAPTTKAPSPPPPPCSPSHSARTHGSVLLVHLIRLGLSSYSLDLTARSSILTVLDDAVSVGHLTITDVSCFVLYADFSNLPFVVLTLIVQIR